MLINYKCTSFLWVMMMLQSSSSFYIPFFPIVSRCILHVSSPLLPSSFFPSTLILILIRTKCSSPHRRYGSPFLYCLTSSSFPIVPFHPRSSILSSLYCVIPRIVYGTVESSIDALTSRFLPLISIHSLSPFPFIACFHHSTLHSACCNCECCIHI